MMKHSTNDGPDPQRVLEAISPEFNGIKGLGANSEHVRNAAAPS